MPSELAKHSEAQVTGARLPGLRRRLLFQAATAAILAVETALRPRPAVAILLPAIAAGASLVSSMLGFMSSGQELQTVMLSEIIALIRELHGRLDAIELVLAKIISDLASLPKEMTDAVERGFDKSVAQDVAAILDNLPGWLRNSQLGQDKKNRDGQRILQDELARLADARAKLFFRSDYAAPVLIAAFFAESRALPLAGLDDEPTRNAELVARYHIRFGNMLDPDRPNSISNVRATLQRAQSEEAAAIGGIVMGYRGTMRDGTYLWFAFTEFVPGRGWVTQRWMRTLTVIPFEGHAGLFKLKLSDGELTELSGDQYPGGHPDVTRGGGEASARAAHAFLRDQIEIFNKRAAAIAKLRDLEMQIAAALFALAGGGEALPLSALEATAAYEDPEWGLAATVAEVESRRYRQLLEASKKRADEVLRASAQHLEDARAHEADKAWIGSFQVAIGVLRASLVAYELVSNWMKQPDAAAPKDAPPSSDASRSSSTTQPAATPSVASDAQIASDPSAGGGQDTKQAVPRGSTVSGPQVDEAERLLLARPRLDLSKPEDRHRAVMRVERIASELEATRPLPGSRNLPNSWTREEVMTLSAIETVNAIERALPPVSAYAPPWQKLLGGEIGPALAIPSAEAPTLDGRLHIADLRNRLNGLLQMYLDKRTGH